MHQEIFPFVKKESRTQNKDILKEWDVQTMEQPSILFP